MKTINNFFIVRQLKMKDAVDNAGNFKRCQGDGRSTAYDLADLLVASLRCYQDFPCKLPMHTKNEISLIIGIEVIKAFFIAILNILLPRSLFTTSSMYLYLQYNSIAYLLCLSRG